MSAFIIACPSSVCASFRFISEVTLSGRLCERKDYGTAWSWNPWGLSVGVTACGTTGAAVPRVTRFLELDGRGTTGDEIRRGQTRVGYKGICPLKIPAVVHGSMVANGTKLFPHWTKSWLGWRPACWTSVKAKPKNRSMSGAGDSRGTRRASGSS